jgi:hypothetical protein
MMKKNMGNVDKSVRVAAALIVVALYFMNVISGVVGAMLLVVAAIFVVTSLVGFCPLYTVLGISTHNDQEDK